MSNLQKHILAIFVVMIISFASTNAIENKRFLDEIAPCCISPERGTCDAATGTCHCHPGFGGKDCSWILCPNNCNNHGSCDYTTGYCSCKPNFWKGADCSIPIYRCINECSGNGQCNTDTPPQGTCICNPGFGLIDCSFQMTPHPLALITEPQAAVTTFDNYNDELVTSSVNKKFYTENTEYNLKYFTTTVEFDFKLESHAEVIVGFGPAPDELNPDQILTVKLATDEEGEVSGNALEVKYKTERITKQVNKGVSINTFHHAKFVLSKNTIQVYVDGTLLSKVTIPEGKIQQAGHIYILAQRQDVTHYKFLQVSHTQIPQ